MEDKLKFINHINSKYDELKAKYKAFCREKDYKWDEDVYSDTILKCYEAIERKGKLDDATPYGIESYFFRSFKTNIQREKQYCRVAKRDCNVSSDNIFQLYEEYYNQTYAPERIKLLNDLWKDFATLYILIRVEDNWDSEHFLLFRLKYLVPQMTYKRLQEKTKVKKCRQKVIEVKNWIN